MPSWQSALCTTGCSSTPTRCLVWKSALLLGKANSQRDTVRTAKQRPSDSAPLVSACWKHALLPTGTAKFAVPHGDLSLFQSVKVHQRHAALARLFFEQSLTLSLNPELGNKDSCHISSEGQHVLQSMTLNNRHAGY